MTEQEIKEIVAKTIDDLLERDMINGDPDLNYRTMGAKLKNHYHKRQNEAIEKALTDLQNDPYFIILPEYYKKDHTLIYIAVCMGCDRVTVARNKKRLVLELFERYKKHSGKLDV